MPLTIKRRVQPGITPDIQQRQGVDIAGQIGGAIESVGRTVEDIGKLGFQLNVLDEKRRLKEQELRDHADATDAITVSKGALIQKDIELKSRKQRNAIGVTLEYDTFAKELFQKTLDSLPTEKAKQLYKADLDVTYLNLRTGMMRHESDEGFKANDAAFTSSANQSVETGIIAYDNPNTHMIEEENIKDMAVALKELHGWDKNQTAEFESKKISDMYEGVIRKWIINDAETAQLSYDKNKDKIRADKRESLEKLLQDNRITQASEHFFNEITTTEPDTTKWHEKLEFMTDIKDVRKETKTLLDAKKKDLKDRAEAVKKADLNNALNLIFDTENLSDALITANKVRDPLDRLKAIKVANSVHERKKRDVETNISVYTKLLDRIDKGEFSSAQELSEFYPELSTSHFDKLVTALKSKLGKAEKGEGAVIKYSTAKDAFSVALGEKYNVEDIDQNRKFKVAYDSLTDAGITDFDTAAKHLKNLFIEGEIIEGGWLGLWDSDMDRTTAERENKLDKWLPNILTEDEDPTLSELRTIQNNLRALGVTTKNDIINRLYKKAEILKLPLSKAEIDQYRKLLRENSGFKQIER